MVTAQTSDLLLTAKIRAHMASEAESWRRLAQAVGAILKTSQASDELAHPVTEA